MTAPGGSGSDGPLRVVVIGGGVAGLATAALLARDGHRVTLVEARDELGGRVGSWASDGFRFDTGPSWYLMPEVFEHFFRLLGTTAAEQLDLVPLDPAYRVLFEGDPDPLVIRADRATNLASFDRLEPGAGEAVGRYLDSARETYRLAVDRFLYSNFDRAGAFADPTLLRRGGRLATLLTRSLDHFIRGFVSDSRLRRVLGYPAVFLGTSPFEAPALYHLMSHLDLEGGVLYPRGGFTELVAALERLARQQGVEFRLGTQATGVETREATASSPPGRLPRRRRARGAISGVRIVGEAGVAETLAADVVVASGDLHAFERTLPRELQSYPERWWDRRIAGPGAVLVLLGVRGELPQLDHHTLLFVDDWRGNFAGIFDAPTRIPDPASLYVCRPSATDETVAPPGHENLFVLVPVPADPTIGAGGVDGTGDAAVEATADAAVEQLASWAGIPDLAERIVVRRTIGPADFEREFRSWRGTALGPAHTLRQSAFLRGSNVSRRIDGLLYAGATTVPGIGLPMCLISAELAVKRLRGDRTTGPLPEPHPEPVPAPETHEAPR